VRAFTEKPKLNQQTKAAKSTKPNRLLSGQSPYVHSVLHLQRAVGSQAVQRTLPADTEEHDDGSLTSASLHLFHDFSRIPVHAKERSKIQPRLKVNAAGDVYDQEAERIADQVLRQEDSEEEETRNVEIQATRADSARDINEDLENRLDRSKGFGSPLSSTIRTIFEHRMQQDFSQVRVHIDNEAAQMNRELGAQAFTHGRDIYFSPGQYNPASIEGKRLLAHELTHVVQQRTDTRHSEASGSGLSQAPACIQRKLVLTGDTANVARVVAVMNAGIDIRYKAQTKASGEVEIVESGYEGPPTREQQFFTERLRPLVNEAGTTTVSVVSGGAPIVGSYASSQIDIADIEALGIGQPGWDARAALLHELVEQREKQLGTTPAQRAYGTATTGAHGQGLAAELGMIGATLESDTGLVSATAHADGTMSGSRTVVFRYPDGTRYRVEVTISHNNITNVARTRLP